MANISQRQRAAERQVSVSKLRRDSLKTNRSFGQTTKVNMPKKSKVR